MNTLQLMRGAVAAQFEGVFEPYFRAAYHHMWEAPKKMDDPQVAREAFISSNIDFDRLFARSLFAARASVVLRGTAPTDHVYAVLPMSHIVGFSVLLVATLMAGATAHVVAKYDPAALAKAIAEEGITDLFGVPATYQRLLEFKAVNGLAQLERGRLRRMLVAGAPLDLKLKARVEEEFGQPLLNNYGITECSPSLTGVRVEFAAER